jgi:Ca2+-binding EF-hand superfamily protein
MADEMTIEEIRALAREAGLNLPDEELQRLLPGVARSKKQAVDLRRLIGVDDEPAAAFAALKSNRK